MTEKARTMAKHSGMGAIPHTKGVTFRVWAPHAEKVYLIGTFNGWSESSIPLFNVKNGYWSADVSEAKVGDEYRYLIHGPAGPLSRIDPYARKVTNAVGNGIIYQNIRIYHFNNEAKLIAFHRSDKQGPKDSVVVAVNMTNQYRDGYVIGFPRAGLWKTRFNSDSYNYGPNFANHPTPDVETRAEKIDGQPCSGKISIGPYTVVIFSQDE